MEKNIRVDGMMNCIKCNFEFNYKNEKIELSKYGRIVYCPSCGNKMILLKRVEQDKKPREHMTKKERRKERINKGV